MHKLKTLKALALILVLAALGTGCASYSCGAPGGLSCSSLSDTYEARDKGQLKHQQASNNKQNKNVTIINGNKANNSDKHYQRHFQDDPHSGKHLKNRKEAKAEAALSKINKQLKINSKTVKNIEPGNPILSRPEVLRVYIARHEADDDFHDEQFVYLRLDAGKWLLLDN